MMKQCVVLLACMYSAFAASKNDVNAGTCNDEKCLGSESENQEKPNFEERVRVELHNISALPVDPRYYDTGKNPLLDLKKEHSEFLPSGTHVTVKGLKNDLHLNGKTGIVSREDPEDPGWWIVELDDYDGEDLTLFSQKNLVPCCKIQKRLEDEYNNCFELYRNKYRMYLEHRIQMGHQDTYYGVLHSNLWHSEWGIHYQEYEEQLAKRIKNAWENWVIVVKYGGKEFVFEPYATRNYFLCGSVEIFFRCGGHRITYTKYVYDHTVNKKDGEGDNWKALFRFPGYMGVSNMLENNTFKGQTWIADSQFSKSKFVEGLDMFLNGEEELSILNIEEINAEEKLSTTWKPLTGHDIKKYLMSMEVPSEDERRRWLNQPRVELQRLERQGVNDVIFQEGDGSPNGYDTDVSIDEQPDSESEETVAEEETPTHNK